MVINGYLYSTAQGSISLNMIKMKPPFTDSIVNDTNSYGFYLEFSSQNIFPNIDDIPNCWTNIPYPKFSIIKVKDDNTKLYIVNRANISLNFNTFEQILYGTLRDKNIKIFKGENFYKEISEELIEKEIPIKYRGLTYITVSSLKLRIRKRAWSGNLFNLYLTSRESSTFANLKLIMLANETLNKSYLSCQVLGDNLEKSLKVKEDSEYWYFEIIGNGNNLFIDVKGNMYNNTLIYINEIDTIPEEATDVSIDYINYITHGNTASIPKTKSVGGYYFNTDIKRPIWFNGEKWVNSEGIDKDINTKGTFSQRPTNEQGIEIGFQYFCTDKQTTEGATNGIMIYYKGEDVWVDALGRVVE